MRTFTMEHSKLTNIIDFAFYWISVLLLAVYLLINESSHQFFGNLFLILAGFISWTAMEYLLHRFVLHGLQPFKGWHREHHRRPNALIVLPPVMSSALILILVFFPVLFMFGLLHACAMTLGVLIGYLAYTIIHHGIHHWLVDSNWVRKRKRWHGLHHHVDQSSYFGVTNSFWDFFFVKVLRI